MDFDAVELCLRLFSDSPFEDELISARISFVPVCAQALIFGELGAPLIY